MSFVDWACLDCDHEQTTNMEGYATLKNRVAPCSRCRVLHLLAWPDNTNGGMTTITVVRGPNDQLVMIGPKLYAKMTQPPEQERAALTPEERDAQ